MTGIQSRLVWSGTCGRLSAIIDVSQDDIRRALFAAHIHPLFTRYKFNDDDSATGSARRKTKCTVRTYVRTQPGHTDGDNKGTFGWPLSSWFVRVTRAVVVRRPV